MGIEEGAVIVRHLSSELLAFGDAERVVRLQVHFLYIGILLCKRHDIGKVRIGIIAAGDDGAAQDHLGAQCIQQLRQQIAAGAGTPLPGVTPAPQVSAEERAANEFAQSRRMTIGAEQSRATLISGGTLATPTQVSGINDVVGAHVSSLIDLVKVVNCVGMGSHKVAYVKADAAAAGKQTEGQAAAAGALGTYDFVTINPESIAVIDYISKQAKKQTPLLYSGKVREQALIALRKAANALVVAALQASDLVAAAAGSGAPIGEKTLRNIALSYGGDDSVVGGAYLVLNKTDLLAFGDVRGDDKQAVYEITPDAGNPNTGTIKDGGLTVRYCINSNLAAGTMYYGNPQCLELDLFSDYEVAVSEDFAFDKLMDTIRGDVEAGADVTVQGGFVKYATA